jgi:hypothetical protein
VDSGIRRSGKDKNVTTIFGEAFKSTPAFDTNLLKCGDNQLHEA